MRVVHAVGIVEHGIVGALGIHLPHRRLERLEPAHVAREPRQGLIRRPRHVLRHQLLQPGRPIPLSLPAEDRFADP